MSVYDNIAFGPRTHGIRNRSELDEIVEESLKQAARISDKTAFFLLGEVIEYGCTDQIFGNPQNKKTEEYITGRFG